MKTRVVLVVVWLIQSKALKDCCCVNMLECLDLQRQENCSCLIEAGELVVIGFDNEDKNKVCQSHNVSRNTARTETIRLQS